MLLVLIPVWCLTCWSCLTNDPLINVLDITSISYFRGLSLFNPYLVCNRMAIVYGFFTYAYMSYASAQSETVHFWLSLFLIAKTLFMLVYSWLLYLMCASEGLTYWMALEFHQYVNLEVSYIFLKVPTILLSLIDVQTFLNYLYTCPVQPSLYGDNSSA